MLTLMNIFLSVLLLTASRVKGDSTTVTLFNIAPGPTSAAAGGLIDVSAIGVEPNGGTEYVEKAEFTTTSGGSPVTTTTAVTFVEAASWLYLSANTKLGDASGTLKQNCTLEANGTTAECVEIFDAAKAGATTTTRSASVVPFQTLTVTGPIPTKSSAATILDNPIFNKLASFFWGIPFILMFF